MLKDRTRFVVEIILVAAVFANLWRLTQTLKPVKPREADEMVVWENRLAPVRGALIEARYSERDLGYMPAGVLNGRPRTADEDIHWVQARYVMIPWNLLQNSLAARYVIADFTGSEFRPAVPAGFTKLYDSNDGLILIERTSPQ